MAVVTRNETAHFTETVIQCAQVQTLVWHGDVLVDWAGGHARIHLDGTIERGGYTRYGRRFDAAISTRDGKHVVIYQRLGTKGLLLRESKLVRELDRSYYCADAYEYPVGFVRLEDGRTGIVHCPDEYNRMEIEDALTGERLTCGERKPADFFHSRLSANPSGTRFMSAGWIWHPMDSLIIFDVGEALRDSRGLDRLDTFPNEAPIGAEVSAAAWIDDDRIVVATPDREPDSLPEGAGPAHLLPRGLGVFDVTTSRCVSAVGLQEIAGTLMPVGGHRVLSLYRHPKLIEIATGAVIHEWPQVRTGEQRSSMISKLDESPPPMALDSAGGRFAVANGDRITILQLPALT